ncbi:uncharacterized protein FA14DRAFT_191005 [Meira miltonrushii]|uniref:Survival Motor Neuron Gemin2-binding domain-containing protein n=1 Tax=Meira miltonrushii TaxID=1280837 RepID=A0A316VCB5_9BASI|nr:uncharacterized protein FA14DRAFT_191005 [Meira miltonrushii]PWN33893.1 hypothetical protein FA14DRAFT_191005 [Meira miltonrushii]
MARRVVAYDDIALQSAGNVTLPPQPSSSSSTLPKASSPTNGKTRDHWTEEGRPITASAARKYRKVLQLLGSGKIEDAKDMLKRTGTAEKSTEIQEALAWATKKRQGSQGETSAQPNGHIPKTNGAVAVGDGPQLEEDEEDGNTSLVGTSISWQGTNQPSSGKGKSLSHAEIWDDSALIDAWDAAMDEYKQFDEMRKAHQNKKNGKRIREEGDIDANTPASKRSSLWHDSPDVGSETAQQAKQAAEIAKETEKELLIRKKREAKELLAQIMPEEEEEDFEGAVLSGEYDTPPSKDVPGNEAWKEACEIVSNTPNRIAGSTDQIPQTYDQAFSNGATAATSSTAQGRNTTTQTMSQEDVLQNLAMSWYYAGYYQAMAVQMTQQQQQ